MRDIWDKEGLELITKMIAERYEASVRGSLRYSQKYAKQ